jgi:hypothetical protein
MKVLIGAVTVLVLMIGAPSVIAFQAYWTPYDDSITSYDQGLRQYHIFLDGTYPSSVDRANKLVNQDLSICLVFISYHHDNTPVVCHQIKESDIPQANDSIVDAGYFVVPDKLNYTAAMACTHTGYHDWTWCNGQIVDGNSFSENSKYLAMMGPTYEDVWINDACVNYHHLKEGIQEFYDCEKGLE